MRRGPSTSSRPGRSRGVAGEVEDEGGQAVDGGVLQEADEGQLDAEAELHHRRQLDRDEGVEAEVGQGPVELDPGRAHAEDGRHLGAEELDQRRQPLLAGEGQQLGEGNRAPPLRVSPSTGVKWPSRDDRSSSGAAAASRRQSTRAAMPWARPRSRRRSMHGEGLGRGERPVAVAVEVAGRGRGGGRRSRRRR